MKEKPARVRRWPEVFLGSVSQLLTTGMKQHDEYSRAFFSPQI